MRIFSTPYELMSESMRDIWEMGIVVKPKSMQNKVVEGNDDYLTKEILMYQYCLTSLDPEEPLYITDKRSKEWVEAEFEERVREFPMNPGDAWKIRQDVWEEFLVRGQFEYTYNERLNYRNNLDTIINELKRNNDSRQAWLPVFSPDDLQGIGGGFRLPCTLGYQFVIREGLLHIIYNQRSADIFTHFGNDVALAWRLKNYVAEKVGVQSGYLYHNITSFHAYQKDWGKLRSCLDDLLKG